MRFFSNQLSTTKKTSGAGRPNSITNGLGSMVHVTPSTSHWCRNSSTSVKFVMQKFD
jgi:hypothetical protein